LFCTGAKWAGFRGKREERSRGNEQHEEEKAQAGDFRTMKMDIEMLEKEIERS